MKLRSSYAEVFCKKGILKISKKLTGKHLCHGLFVQAEFSNFIKKETMTQVFSCEYWDIFKSNFIYRIPTVDDSAKNRFIFCLTEFHEYWSRRHYQQRISLIRLKQDCVEWLAQTLFIARLYFSLGFLF